MEKVGGVYMMPCKVNDLRLRFIFDTGASDVSISLTEAMFMLKNGYLSENDFKGKEYYRIANGEIAEGTEIILRKVTIGDLELSNVKASVIHEMDAPLLLGQSALSKLGKIEFDYSNNTLTINGSSNEDSSYGITKNTKAHNYSDPGNAYYSGNYKFRTWLRNPPIELPLRTQPKTDADVIYKCPKNARVYVIDNSNEFYFKVYVNGHIGYLSSYWLLKKK